MSNSDIKININYHEVYKSDRWLDLERKHSETYEEYRRQWEENPQKGVVAPFPLHLSLETTNLCNLKCPMCARTLKAQKGYLEPGRFMDFELFKKIIDEGAEKGLKAIKLNAGDSEPLMAKDIAERARYAKQKGILEVMINTNATLLTKETSSKLIDAGLDRLLVSFDSPYKEEYEKIRVGAKFDQVVSNLMNFLELRGNKDYPTLRLAMVKMRDNEQDVDAFIEMWQQKADILSVLDYQNPHSMDENDRASYEPHLNPDFICSQLWQRLQVRVDGTVTPCCGDYLNELKLGNANNTTINAMWHGNRLKQLRKLHLEGNALQIKTCRMCGLTKLPDDNKEKR